MLRSSLGLVIFAAMVLVPAGSLRFWQGWMLVALIVIPYLSSFVYFYKHDPQVLERRMQSKEKVGEQKLLMRLATPVFFTAILLPGLDYRMGWSRDLLSALPLWLSMLSQGLVLSGLILMFWVMKVNSFASRTIQVEAGQPVISTGPYALVRHPMYSGALLMGLFTPLALGSYLAWPVFALLIPFYVLRLLNEERVLRQELPGYAEYCLRTRCRLVPFVW
ncbi:MAG: isoprenylcysteine carboxylmethyltransferase family protein [Terracidiphilus sp.]|nr:isoprenylcysteine carboxylmethyltransferase family protein [Terracidiphilus sp.]